MHVLFQNTYLTPHECNDLFVINLNLLPWDRMRSIVTTVNTVLVCFGLFSLVFFSMIVTHPLVRRYTLYKYYFTMGLSGLLYLVSLLISLLLPNLWHHLHSELKHFPYVTCVIIGSSKTFSRCIFTAYAVTFHAESFVLGTRGLDYRLTVTKIFHTLVC